MAPRILETYDSSRGCDNILTFQKLWIILSALPTPTGGCFDRWERRVGQGMGRTFPRDLEKFGEVGGQN
jgi:hypothetical protein